MAYSVSVIGSIAILTWIFGGESLFGGDPLLAVLSGGALLGAFYMATCYVTSPTMRSAQLVYGVGIGRPYRTDPAQGRLPGGYLLCHFAHEIRSARCLTPGSSRSGSHRPCEVSNEDIISIIFRLTLSCIVAGLIMGGTFIFTDRAKKANEHAREEKGHVQPAGPRRRR
ncbi:MAG: RnfABCDGE type electron transport complex subunit D [Desulfofustis sp. PB-SRB1]|nr:RnfABCDGE type electron transport complex subunit D [Desulfofustis sp. PB-SRB1]